MQRIWYWIRNFFVGSIAVSFVLPVNVMKSVKLMKCWSSVNVNYVAKHMERRLEMMEILLLLFVIAVGFTVLGLVIYHGTRRGEDCHGYSYNCPTWRRCYPVSQ